MTHREYRHTESNHIDGLEQLIYVNFRYVVTWPRNRRDACWLCSLLAINFQKYVVLFVGLCLSYVDTISLTGHCCDLGDLYPNLWIWGLSLCSADTDSNGSQPSLAFQFLRERGQSIQVLQSSLWLYIYSADTPIRDSRVMVQIYLSAQDAGNRTLLLQKGVEIQRGSWHTFAITHALQEFLDGGQPQLRMEVACRVGEQDLCMAQGSASSAHRPFLVTQVRLRKDESRHALQKRSLQCGDDVTVCCKKDFYVKFRDIKWQDWIIAPEGYHMNYCMGQCPHHLAGSPGIASSFHAAVFSQLKANGIETGVTSCCVPIKRRPLSMVHFDSPHSIVKTDVEDMIVESCGCT